MRPTDRLHVVKDDFREPFARDRDRIIHCSSFRRLEYKTQVFINQDGDYFRTRLTHSLEVSQIAKTIARSLGCSESLCEAIALGHDLGHTPFGHVGGNTLDQCMKTAGSGHGFDHNFQSFRTVAYLEKRYKDYDGLNLTFATLEGFLKHSYPYKKPFLLKYDELFGLDFHPSIEAMIVDRSDEIAYISHDIDDGIQFGLIDFEDLQENALIADMIEIVKKEGLDMGDELFRFRFVSRLIRYLVISCIDYSKKQLPKTGAVLCKSIPITDHFPISYEETLMTEIKKLKKILFQKLYRHERISSKMYAGKQCIKQLFNAFKDDRYLLPLPYSKRLEVTNENRVIADYIASMSDRYALERYREIYGY